MTSGSILPTFGPAPPNIRRAVIPRELQPELPNAADRVRNPPPPVEPEPQESQSFLAEQGSQGRPISAAGLTAVSAQEGDEDTQTVLPAPPPPSEGPSEATRRLNQAVEAANQSDDGENARGLTEEEEAYVRELQAIDREVRSHEAAHAAKGGAYAGRPSYEYVTGPDGIRYAVSGSVQIDTGTVPGDPEATIRKLETVRRAALAPSSPSGQDRAVAAQAEVGIREAEADLREKRSEEAQAEAGDGSNGIEAEDDTQAQPSISELIAETQSEDATAEDTPFATNLVAQAAFSQAASTQTAFSPNNNLQRGIDLIA